MENRTTLSDDILKQLEGMITGGMKPGERLPTEMELAERFSVGRSTIRESLKVLTAKGLITRSNEGTFVSDEISKCLVDPLSLLLNMNIANVDDLLELRQMLELETVQIAAERITPELLEKLNHVNWRMTEPGLMPKELQKLDIAFHNTIAEATGNAVLMELLDAIRHVIAERLEYYEMPAPVMAASMELHQQILKALDAHDSEQAYNVMKNYFTLNRKNNFFCKEPMKRQNDD